MEQMQSEAHILAGAPFGPELLATLGDMFQLRAGRYLANELAGYFSMTKRSISLRHKSLLMKHEIQFRCSAGWSLIVAMKAGVVARSMEKVFDEIRLCFLQTAWASVVRDIDCTMKGVCHKLLL